MSGIQTPTHFCCNYNFIQRKCNQSRVNYRRYKTQLWSHVQSTLQVSIQCVLTMATKKMKEESQFIWHCARNKYVISDVKF